MTNSERLALFARGSRAPVVQQLSVSTSSQSCVRTTLSQISGFQLYSRLSFLSCLPPPSNLRCRFGITVSCTRSGGGPIRKCACSCPTWKGRTPPSVQCRPSRPRKWLMRPSYECRVVPRGIFKNKARWSTRWKKKQKNNKINHINELLHFIWTILRGESYFLPLFSFIAALDVNYYGVGQPQKVVLGRTHSGVLVDVETQSCHWTDRQTVRQTQTDGRTVLGCERHGHMDDGRTSPTVCRWHKLMKY